MAAISKHVSEVISEGFETTVHPAANAGAIFHCTCKALFSGLNPTSQLRVDAQGPLLVHLCVPLQITLLAGFKQGACCRGISPLL